MLSIKNMCHCDGKLFSVTTSNLSGLWNKTSDKSNQVLCVVDIIVFFSFTFAFINSSFPVSICFTALGVPSPTV